MENTNNASHSLIALPSFLMIDHPSTRISSRKRPKQARSNELVDAAILQAAVQVLAEEGAQRFTTARVAERAGVSIGSLYQHSFGGLSLSPKAVDRLLHEES
jgi:hypothetical protein